MSRPEKYVALATDANPTYAIFAPVMVRLWQRLGYRVILFLHDTPERWQADAFTQLVHGRLVDLTRCTRLCLQYMPRIEPFSVGNTMRVARLAASALPGLRGDDFILTSDIDMAPLSRSFFDRDPSKVWALRGDAYGAFDSGAVPLDAAHRRTLLPGAFRLPLCYIGAPVDVWRGFLPVSVGDPARTIRNLAHGLRHDSIEYDEATCSLRLLMSRWAAGHLEHVEGALWRQGDLYLVSATTREGLPLGMQLGARLRSAKRVDPSAIDWHIKETGAWIGDSLALYHPDETEYIRGYWPQACAVAGVHGG